MQYDQQSEANKAKLLSMAKQHGNKECADCSSRSVKWACFNHGTFVCIKCSGIHRSLGRHISKVKSLTLDKWTAEEMAGMRGNIAANSEYLYNLPDGLDKPDENDDTGRRKWIERKYVKQEWARRSDQAPGQGAMERRGVQSTPSLAEVSSTSSLQMASSQPSIQSQMQQTVFSTPQQSYQQVPQLAAQYSASAAMVGNPQQLVAPTSMAYQPNQLAAPAASALPAGMPAITQQQQKQEMIQKMLEYQNQYMQQYKQYQQYQQQGQPVPQMPIAASAQQPHVQQPMPVPIQQQQAFQQMPAQPYPQQAQQQQYAQKQSFNAYNLLDNL